MKSLKELKGIVPVVYAFFNADGQLDRGAMRRQIAAIRAADAPAVTLLGLATEVNKLSWSERCQVIDWTAEDAEGQLPMLVTVNGENVQLQLELARRAEQAGAAGLIFQPPPKAVVDDAVRQGHAHDAEAYCEAFFRQLMREVGLPAAIQNAPEYLQVGLSSDAILRLAADCPNFAFLKGEGPSVLISGVVQALAGRLPVFNGRGGQELVDNLRAGCAGMIVAPDSFDFQQRVYRHHAQGEIEQAEAVYRQVLPAIVFVMQSLDSLICYGKRIAAWRMGLETVFDRAPAMKPTTFGESVARRFADQLGPLA